MSGKIIEILADGFEEVEAIAPLDLWRRCGITVILAAVSGKSATGAHGVTVNCDIGLDEADFSGCDAVFLPGGMPGSLNLRNDPRVIAGIKETVRSGGIAAAICAAPMVLAEAGVLTGRRAAMYPSAELRNRYCPGIEFEEIPAVRDGNIITGRGPGAAFALALRTAEALGMGDAAVAAADGMLIDGASR